MKLTTWERATCYQIIGAIRGDVATIRRAWKLLEKLELTPEEIAEAGILTYPNGNMVVSDQLKEWDVEISDQELLKQAVAGFANWAAIDCLRADKLRQKLGIED